MGSKDENDLKNTVKNHRNFIFRLEAVDRTNNESILEKIAKNDVSPDIRAAVWNVLLMSLF